MAKKKRTLTKFGKDALIEKHGDGFEFANVEYDPKTDSAKLSLPITPHEEHYGNFATGRVNYLDLSYGGKPGFEGQITVSDGGDEIDIYVEYKSPLPTSPESGAKVGSCGLSLSRSLAKEVGLALLRHAELGQTQNLQELETRIDYTAEEFTSSLHIKEVENVSNALKGVEQRKTGLFVSVLKQECFAEA